MQQPQNEFPSISIPGQPVNPQQYVEPGTGAAIVGAYLVGVLAALFVSAVTYGVALIAFLISPLINWFIHRKAMAMLHGSGIRVSEVQFPEIHRCVTEFSSRMGIQTPPDVYIVEENLLNAAAIRYGKKNVILLTNEIIHGCLQSEPKALSFIIGHELGHIALNHNTPFRLFIANHFKKLSRLNEYTVDRVAMALVGDRKIAFSGLLLLTSGYHLSTFVNVDAIVRQAQEVQENKYSGKAEKTLTHPLLLNRMHRVICSK